MRINARRRFRHAVMLSGSLAVLAGTGPAFAQQDNPVAQGEQVIVVTAQFREQALQDTPLAITAIDAEMLQSRSQTDLIQITNQAPNVTITQATGGFGPSITANIRGVGQSDFNPAYEPGVGIYIDDVYQPLLTGALFDLLDLERVEVLRGPQGTLTGRNSIGGAIKMISRKPQGSNSGFAEATYGSRNRIGLRAGADFELAENVFARFTGVMKDQEGYVDVIDYGCANPDSGIPATEPVGACVADKAGDVSYGAIRGMVRVLPSDKFEVTVSADYSTSETGAAAEILTAANNPAFGYDNRFVCGPYCVYKDSILEANPEAGFQTGEFTPFQKFRNFGVSAAAELEISDTLSLSSITAYREVKSTWETNDDLSPIDLQGSSGLIDGEFFSQEVRLNGIVGDSVEFTLGAYYSDQTTIYAARQDIRWAGLQFRSDDPVDADSKAAFGTIIWKPMDRLTLTGGLRYTEESKDYTFVRTNFDGSANPAVGALDGVTASYQGSELDYRVSIDYRWTPDFLTYATIATGFKGGGISPRPYVPTQAAPFDPEKLTSYEVGFKSEPLARSRFNVTAFYNDFKDIQLTLFACPQLSPFPEFPCALTANAGEAEMWGVEGELFVTPVDGFDIDATVSYLDFDYTSLNPVTGLSGDLEAPRTPKWNWSLGAQYAFRLGNAGSLTTRLDASYRGSFYTNADNSPFSLVDDHIVANARVTWRNQDEDLSVAFEVTNLFDEYYYSTNFDLYSTSGIQRSSVARPREFAVTVRKEF